MLKKNIIPILILIMLVSTISATTLNRNLPSTLDSGETFTVTYSTTGKSGKWFSAWQDFVTGCSPVFYRDFMISEGGSKSISRTFVAPQSGECTFSGIYQFTGESQKDFPTVTIPLITQCNPKTCFQLNKECGNLDNGCGNILNCGFCSSGETCNSGVCESICTPQSEKKCYNNDVYWYDSCGNRETRFQDCGTDGCSNGVCINSEIPIQYDNYFNDNPKIKSVTINRYNEETLDYFWNFINELEITGKIEIDKPRLLPRGGAGGSSYDQRIKFERDISNKILASKGAHSIWLDKNNKVSWSLEESYSIEDLEHLFFLENSWLDSVSSDAKTKMFWIIDYSPSIAYKYSKDLIKGTKEETLYAIIEDLKRFRHRSTKRFPEESCVSDVDCAHLAPQNPLAIPLCRYGSCRLTEANVYVSLERAFSEEISRWGCHSMSMIAISLSNSLNIVGIYETDLVSWYRYYPYFVTGHGGALFPEIGLLVHGDDIYRYSDAPAQEILTSWDFFLTEIKPFGERRKDFSWINPGAKIHQDRLKEKYG